ncbi:MAG: histidine kinase [Acidobacteriota bacterium]
MTHVAVAEGLPLESAASSSNLARRLKPIALATLGWGALVVISTTTVYISRGGQSFGDWIRPLSRITTYYFLWAFASLGIYRFIDRFPFRLYRLVWLVPTHLVLATGLALIITLLVHGAAFPYWMWGPGASGFQSLTASMYLFIVVGCLFLRDYRAGLEQERLAQQMKLRATVLENRLNVARLDALRMQINPHFLFNALNSIASLIETQDNDHAYRTTELLGSLLRTILDHSHEASTTLAEEVEFVRRYVEVERVRFGDRLSFEVEIADDCLDRRVPALILQPIVENSVKHAVVPTQSPVQICLRCELRERTLELRVEDDGPGFPQLRGAQSRGLGLENVRRRLELIHGKSAQLDIESTPGERTTVSIRLPA